ncbi:MAG: SDR family NAD(P)-dependent oxidoreductase [Bryobacterales bacterium]|nr:SDR family NAD(P)-dependent oxidoreductase [Bryobacterales bacterium]
MAHRRRMDIQGKVVLITGASEGIGAACAARFRERGASLALMARNRTNLERVAAGKGLVIAGDVTADDDRRMAVDATLDRYGRIDILINSAGAGLYAPAWQAPMDAVRRMYDLNFFGALGMIQRAVPPMQRQGGGCIVNVSSIAGKVTLPWLTLYSASKYALGSLTDGLRMELRRDGIHAMTVCPGYVPTKFQDHMLVGRAPANVRDSSLFRIRPEECAAAIARGVEKNARTVVAPRVGWVFIALERLFPGWIDRRLEEMHRRGPAL